MGRTVAHAFGGVGGAFILVVAGAALPEIRRRLATRVLMTAFSIAPIAGLPAGIMLTNLPAAHLLPVLVVTTFYWIFTSGRWVPAMALVTSSALPGYRGSFMSINASLQQMAIGLAAVVAGAVVGEARSGEITGYALA